MQKIETIEDKDRYMKLPNGNKITFNDDQYEAIRKMKKWLMIKTKENKIFTLAGVSGSGKTTLVKKIINSYRGRVVVSAPTHKAKKVIMKTTGMEGQTLHSLLGLRPDVELDSFNPNDPKFNPIALPRISEYNLVVIDEASMINQELFDLINENIADFNIKVLYMGDPAQIPPIGEKESVVFKQDNEHKHELTVVMRQDDGNPLFEIYDKLRDNQLDEYGGFSRKTKINSKGEGVRFLNDKEEFRKELTKFFNSNQFRDNPNFVKLIAWRNDVVMASNKIIREIIFGKDAPLITVGDVIMGYRSVRADRQYFNIIDNSEDYLVTKVSKKDKNKFGLDGYSVVLRETLPNGNFMHKTVFIVDHTDESNLHDYAEIHDGLRDIAKENKKEWRKYYEFRRESLLMVKIDKYRDDTIRGSGNLIVKDIDYGLSLTSHKAQGSTYDHVFVIENDILLNPKTKEKNQILYVALSRPKISATVLSNLKEE